MMPARTALVSRWVLAAKVLAVVVSLGVSAYGTLFMLGAVGGTLERNLGARAATLAEAFARGGQGAMSGVARDFPMLAEGGGDLAEVRDDRGTLLYRSPSFAGGSLNGGNLAVGSLVLDPKIPLTKLFRVSFSDGSSGYGVRIRHATQDGRRFEGTYVSTTNRLTPDAVRWGALFAGFVVLPTVAAVVLMPGGRRAARADKVSVR